MTQPNGPVHPVRLRKLMPHAEISKDEALEMIGKGSRNWRSIIPEENFEWFCDRVQVAVEIYFELWDRSVLAAEISAIENAARNRNDKLPQLIEGSSPILKTVLEQHSALPPPPETSSEQAVSAYAQNIRTRLLSGAFWQEEGKRRRKKYKLKCQIPFKRPKRDRIAVLASFVVAAYVGATGKKAVRSWSNQADESPAEVILGDIFANLSSDDINSANMVLQRHLINRKAKLCG